MHTRRNSESPILLGDSLQSIPVYRQAMALRSLNRRFSELAEPSIEHVVVSGYKKGVLTVIADSPVWATRLRFATCSLVVALRHDAMFQKLEKIRILVATCTAPVRSQSGHALFPWSLSEQSAKDMEIVAQTLQNTHLKTVCLRIARRTSLEKEQKTADQMAQQRCHPGYHPE